MRRFILTTLLTCSFFALKSQTQGLNMTIQINAVANGDGSVTLKWTKSTFNGRTIIYKRTNITDNWGASYDTVTGNVGTWTDTKFGTGQYREYALMRDTIYKDGFGNQYYATGFIFCGNKAPEIPSFGSVILLVDSTFIKPLASELATLKNDLQKNGWVVNTIYAGRNEKPPLVKARIKNLVDNAKPAPRAVYIIGHVPVPYSGILSGSDPNACAYPPDGHVEGSGNHTGAWPADVYYGDFDQNWTDNSANISTGLASRLYNIPGDGKFDQCQTTNVSLEIGRVDLYDMPIFNKSDTLMLRNYLNKAHLWRKDSISIVERGLVDDNFNTLSLARTGWAAQSCMVGIDSVFGNRDYMSSQTKDAYLWSYGCGAGSFNSCAGIGAMNNWNPAFFRNIFTGLAGSFFGDWDNTNNFLRGPLASGSLASFWGGIPTWYMQHMALGYPIGFSARFSQNYPGGDFNGSQRGVHIALMGDPTTRVRNVPATGKLTISSTGGKVKLNWGKAKGKLDGYAVFRIDTVTNTWTRVNANIITDTFYTDDKNWVTGKYKYAVRSIRLETNPSGSWYNLGAGDYAWVNHTNQLTNFNPLKMGVFPNPTNGSITLNVDENGGTSAYISMFDMAGKMVFETKAQVINGQCELNLPDQMSGNYILRCQINERTGVSRVMVAR